MNSVFLSATHTPIRRLLMVARPVVDPSLVSDSAATPIRLVIPTCMRLPPLPPLEGARTTRHPPVLTTVLTVTTCPTLIVAVEAHVEAWKYCRRGDPNGER